MLRRMHTVHNARIQLVATGFNNLALAVIVAPIVSGQLPSGGQAVVTFAWVTFGAMPHVFGQMVLGGLRQ